MRATKIKPENFQSLKPFLTVAREQEKEKYQRQPLRSEDSLEWTDDEWIVYIVNAARIYSSLCDSEMAENPAAVFAVFQANQ